LATNKDTGDKIALKLMDRSKMTPADAIRAKREIDINERVSHPNIVKVSKIIQTTECVGLVMELYALNNIKSTLKKSRSE